MTGGGSDRRRQAGRFSPTALKRLWSLAVGAARQTFFGLEGKERRPSHRGHMP